MEDQPITTPSDFVTSLGRLHDVRIDKFVIDTDSQSLNLVLNDINAAFTQSPEYQGHRPATLVFSGVTELTFDVDFDEGVRISRLDIVTDSPAYRLEIDLNIGGGPASRGRRSIVAKFKSLVVRDAQ